MATSTVTSIVAEPRNVSVGNFSITETEPGVFTLTGLDLSTDDRESFEMLLSVWKYGLVDGGGEPTSTWSAEKLQSARAWLDAHRAE